MTATTLLGDVSALLGPVDAKAPAGADLRYLPVYDEIKAARREAEADPRELGPWKRIADLVANALTRSKDLQLAAWLAEALARVEGFPGTAAGLLVTRRLLDEYWDTFYPPIDPDDSDPLDHRRGLLEWLDERLPEIVKTAPVTGPPSLFGVVHFEVAQKTGDELRAMIDEGWPNAERFMGALQSTAAARLESTLADIVTCEMELAALQASVDRWFTGASGSVSFSALRQTFESARWLVERVVKKATATAAEAAGTSPIAAAGATGDDIWSEALTLTRDSRMDGLRLVQSRLSVATSGRDTFLRQLQLAELSLEAGVHSLAFPVFDELARIVDARRLDEWEDRALVTRVLAGLARCCSLFKAHNPAAAAREAELLDRIANLNGARVASSS